MHDDTMTAEQHRAEAARAAQSAADSWDRCDTDGFLSQWASGLTAQLHREQASILDAGGVQEFLGLFDAEGRRIRAKLIEGRYGMCWMLLDARDKATGDFVPFVGHGGGTSRKQKAMGLHEALEVAPAQAVITGSGHGLSGSAWVDIIRTDGGCPADAITLEV